MHDHRTGVDLFVLSRALEAVALDAVRAAGVQVTPAQARLLARVGEGGTRAAELAERALVTKQTVSHLLEQLERAGLVERVPDPRDGRARLVRLTDAARSVVPVANSAVRDTLAGWERRIGAERMADLADALAELARGEDPFGGGGAEQPVRS